MIYIKEYDSNKNDITPIKNSNNKTLPGNSHSYIIIEEVNGVWKMKHNGEEFQNGIVPANNSGKNIIVAINNNSVEIYVDNVKIITHTLNENTKYVSISQMDDIDFTVYL